MSKIVTYISLLAVISAIFIITGIEPEKSTDNDGPEFTKEYQDWFFNRLKDPETGEIPDNIKYREYKYVSNIPGSYKFETQKGNQVQSLNTWTPRGPYYIGGRTRAIAFDESDHTRLLAGGVDSGMWLSTDDGQTWKMTTRPDQLASVTTITQDVREGKEHIWYHGTGEIRGGLLPGNGIYKSTDNGNSWFRLESTVTGNVNPFDQPFDYVNRVRTNPAAPMDKDEVYAAIVFGGIFRSADGGENWTPVLGGGISGSLSLYTDIEVTSEGVFYATMSSLASGGNVSTVKGIFRSTDGENWTNITPDGFPENYNRIVIGIDPQNENKVYFFGETPEFGIHTTNSRGHDLWHSLWRYEYVSGDGTGEGAEWTDLTHNLPNPELVRHQMNTQGGYDMVLKVHPTDSNVVYIGGVNLYRSDTAWQTDDFKVIGGTCSTDECNYHYRYPNHHADQHEITFFPGNPDIMYTGSDGGIHKTLDPKSDNVVWESLNNGYLTTQFYSVAIDHATESEMILGGQQDNGTLFTNSGQTDSEWPMILTGDGFHCRIADSSKFMVISKNSSNPPGIKIYKADVDENGNLSKAVRIDPIGGEDFIWDTPFELDPNDNNKLYVAGGRSVWRNNDLSKIDMVDVPDVKWQDVFDIPEIADSISTEWDELTNTNVVDLNNGTDDTERITAISVSEEPANVVYYGTNRGRVFRIDNAHQGNPDVVEITGNEFNRNATVGSIAIDPDNAYEAIALFTNYSVKSLFHTKDGGENWQQIGGNLEENPSGAGAGPAMNWIEIMKVNDKKVYMVGTSTGLYLTSYLNGMGTAWMKEAETIIGNKNVMMIDYRESDGFTAVGTYATGSYSTYFNNTPALPGDVTLRSPENNFKYSEDEVMFEWEDASNAIFYRLEVARDENFNDIEFMKNDIQSTEHLVYGLELGYRDYYWRVSAIGPGGESNYSDVRNLTTGLGSPRLIYPEDKSEDIPVDVTLEWEQMPEVVTGYRVMVGNNFAFTNVVADEILDDNKLHLENLQGEKNYFWKLKAYTENDSSDFSQNYRFKTTKTSSVETLIADRSIKLYPNPVRNELFVDFNFAVTLPVKITITDINGRQVNNLNISELRLKQGTIKIDLSDLPSGEYFIRFESNDKALSRKIIKI